MEETAVLNLFVERLGLFHHVVNPY